MWTITRFTRVTTTTSDTNVFCT